MATKKTNIPKAAAPTKASQPAPAIPAEIPKQPAAQAVQSELTPTPEQASIPDSNPAGEPATTGDPEGGTPSPEYRGQTAKQIAQKQAKTEPAAAPSPEPKQADPYEELAAKYAKHYPNNSTFHITTDKQVFLAGDLNLAILHQGALRSEEKIHSINVKR